MSPEITEAGKALRAPRAAGVAGIAFSVLLGASFVLIHLIVPSKPSQAGTWLTDPMRRDAVVFGLNLIPFAGIAFLWFIGVVRDRIGEHEDRFFASVFLGSGLLFVAMLFVAAAIAAGLLSTLTSSSSSSVSSDTWRLGRNITFLFLTTYAMRMAAVFMIATATITLRVAFMSRWLGYLGYLSALVLLLSAGILAWVELLFPVWVFLVSLSILRAKLPAEARP
jgi:hypothetical protein